MAIRYDWTVNITHLSRPILWSGSRRPVSNRRRIEQAIEDCQLLPLSLHFGVHIHSIQRVAVTVTLLKAVSIVIKQRIVAPLLSTVHVHYVRTKLCAHKSMTQVSCVSVLWPRLRQAYIHTSSKYPYRQSTRFLNYKQIIWQQFCLCVVQLQQHSLSLSQLFVSIDSLAPSRHIKH